MPTPSIRFCMTPLHHSGDPMSSYSNVAASADRVAATTQDVLLLIARILAGWIFIHYGFGKITDVGPFAASLARDGVPLPMVVGVIAACVEFFGGIALILGIQVRYTSLLLFAFVIVATLLRHRYWDFAEVAARRAQELNFYKNASMAGGLLALFVAGGGRIGLDGMLRKR